MNNELINFNKGNNNQNQLSAIETGLLKFLEEHQLPIKNIFAPVKQRGVVFKNIEDVIKALDEKSTKDSIYISKFIGAIACGLFDAALNYLWDETILHIRKRVIQYDLDYFYANAVGGEKRKNLKSEEDIKKLDDYELIKGAKAINLISDLGFQHLEYIKYMRNYASAAHPNQNELTGLQLISWLETCIKEVISLPILDDAIKIKELIVNIKSKEISNKDAEEISAFFNNLTTEQANNLSSGFWGIYTNPKIEEKTRKNIILLLPKLWKYVDEDTRNNFGLKCGYFAANNYQDEKKLARQFFQTVNAESYIPDDLRVVEIEEVISNLLTAHRNVNNFYTEPSFARQLKKIGGNRIPNQINKRYVSAIVEVYLTNGFNPAWNAEPIYENLIKEFDEYQASIAVLSFSKIEVSNKLQIQLCRNKFLSILDLVRARITKKEILELIKKIKKIPENELKDLDKNKHIKLIVENLNIVKK